MSDEFSRASLHWSKSCSRISVQHRRKLSTDIVFFFLGPTAHSTISIVHSMLDLEVDEGYDETHQLHPSLSPVAISSSALGRRGTAPVSRTKTDSCLTMPGRFLSYPHDQESGKRDQNINKDSRFQEMRSRTKEHRENNILVSIEHLERWTRRCALCSHMMPPQFCADKCLPNPVSRGTSTRLTAKHQNSC